ncbi:MAG: hypothetical protein ACHP9Z_32295, partial [Streptosporangiales bacterium]
MPTISTSTSAVGPGQARATTPAARFTSPRSRCPTADATGPRQDLAERGRAAEEVVYGGVSTGAGNDRAGRHRNPARIIEEYYEQVLATLQGGRDRLAGTLLD